jgi:flavin-dependent dehydrogenase
VAIRGYTRSAEAATLDSLKLIWPGGEWGRAYAWAFPIGDGTVNVGAGVFETGAATRADLERLAAEALPSGLAADPDTVRGHLLPLTSQGPVYGAGRVLLCGDAAGLVNPLSGEGIFYALASGALAAEAIVASPGEPLGPYQQSMGRRFSRHFATTRLFAKAADSPALLGRAIRTAARDQKFFARLADVALGDGSFDLRSAAAFAAGPYSSARRRQ